jgi:hypothetical protein
MIADLRTELRSCGVLTAVASHDSATLFDWLMTVFSFQGIADRIAEGFIQDHGNIEHSDVAASLARSPACSKLASYWQYYDCHYQKGLQTCRVPRHFNACPLPRHKLRNGHLNQTAYSLFLFIRDIANGDLVAWIDQQLVSAGRDASSDPMAAVRDALIEPLRGIYGVSDKVLAIALAALLMGAGRRKARWFDVGVTFVAVDTLVHNFLHRTGLLQRFKAEHAYGSGCYRAGGCADMLRLCATHIDARAFNPTFPRVFPRFVQNAVWRYCAQSAMNVCNRVVLRKYSYTSAA